MTLFSLANSTTLQGNICLSVWDGDEEVAREELRNVDDLASSIARYYIYEDLEVKFVFSTRDGILHIELEGYAPWLHEESEE